MTLNIRVSHVRLTANIHHIDFPIAQMVRNLPVMQETRV